MKKIIFFDGDGTLWYPEKTKRQIPPQWVYTDPDIADPIAEFVVTPTAPELLQELGKLGIKRVLLSTSPLAEEEAIMHRIAICQHIDIHHLLDDVHAAPVRVTGKSERIIDLLQRYELQAADALMVGDTYAWDYQAAENVGVEGLLLRSEYQAEHIPAVGDRAIDNIIDVLRFV